MDDTTLVGAAPASKAALRRSMRALRRGLEDRDLRSSRLWARVEELPAVVGAHRVLVFTTIVGEPETAPFVAWCADRRKRTAVPEVEVDVTWPDVVIVPGLAFTRAGDRLGRAAVGTTGSWRGSLRRASRSAWRSRPRSWTTSRPSRTTCASTAS